MRNLGLIGLISTAMLLSNAEASSPQKLTFAGSPATKVAVGSAYYFRPIVTDYPGANIRFYITNRPSWAYFSPSTGVLSGKPTTTGIYKAIGLYAWDGITGRRLPEFQIQVTPKSSLSISGVAATTGQVGKVYDFRPTVTAVGTAKLQFSAKNVPQWAVFSTTSGELKGSPTTAGTASNIGISVSDGKSTATLPNFSITVQPSPVATPQYKLSLTVSGSGSISDPKQGITCSGTCTPNVNAGTAVNLIPAAASGYVFSSWGGSCAASTICQFTMNGNTTVYANFVKSVSNPPPITPPPTSVPPNGTPYPGYTYHLPTARPFISLNQYANPSAASVARLKAQVDDVVAVTKAQGANTTYDKLVSALNSNHYAYSSVDSVVMFRLTGNTDYIDQAIRMVDLFVISENALIAAGSRPNIAGDSYLNVGEYLSQLALAYDYGYNRLSASQRAAWSSFAEQAVFNVWNANNAVWGSHSFPWTGWATNDPGDNYYYSFLKATQLWALASQNQTWITFLQTQKYAQLVPFFSILAGGGSREGTGYGTAIGSLFEDYSYWKDSTGEDLSAYSNHARDTIDYWIHATVPNFEYFAPIGDQSRSSMPIMFDYQRKLVLEGVALNQGTPQGMRGLWWLSNAKVTDGGNGWVAGSMRYNFDFRYDLLSGTGTQQAPTALMYNATGTGALFARSDWSTSASWMHVNAGYYDQSHAHQDQGAFSFFKGTWLTVTSNVYSNSGINQGTEVDNVLRFDLGGSPVPQNNSVSTKTVSDSGGTLQINADLSPAYSANASKVSRWQRQYTYQRATHTLTIHDVCTVASGVTPVWQLHLPVSPTRQSDGSYVAGSLRIAPSLPASPTVSIVNMKNTSSDYTGGYRLELRGPANQCEFQVTLTAQ